MFARLTLRVVDVNDNRPSIVVNALTGSRVAEVREHVDPPGTFVAHLAVTDADTALNGQTECQLTDDSHFRLEPPIPLYTVIIIIYSSLFAVNGSNDYYTTE